MGVCKRHLACKAGTDGCGRHGDMGVANGSLALKRRLGEGDARDITREVFSKNRSGEREMKPPDRPQRTRRFEWNSA